MSYRNLSAIIICSALLALSCTNNKAVIEVKNFNPIANYGGSDSVKKIDFDYSDAYFNGFIVPTVKQVPGGKFIFSFDVRNTSDAPQEIFYKLYYQNESYKIPENETGAENNFYGSWEDTGIEFKSIGTINPSENFQTVTDSIRIVGNPRNDSAFFQPRKMTYSKADVKEMMDHIKGIPAWNKSIVEKAAANKRSYEKQLEDDAVFMIMKEGEKDKINCRWMRNPRTGTYSFMLVAVTADELKQLPAAVRNISKKDAKGKFVNPFSYFATNNYSKGLTVLKSSCLAVTAKIPLTSVYINPNKYPKGYSKAYFNSRCDTSFKLDSQAAIEQFMHMVNESHTFENVPAIIDVNGNEFTREMYNSLNPGTSPVKVPIGVTDCPCKTVKVDTANNKIVMFNPATENKNYRKENVGIFTRHGLSYGKYRVKVKLTELLNKHQVWNGLTNAIWLIAQEGNWNMRKSCDNGGFIPKSESGPKAKRMKTVSYSEIDIEIVKSARGWPKTSYNGSNLQKPAEPASDSDKIMVTATNWDLACKDAKDFQIGAYPFKHKENTYILHRWDHWYQAVTTKYPASDDELFGGDYYWFEIEWKPTEIIWRMGPEKDQMKEFAYMDYTVTNIPDNQMLLVITQEYHLTNWWPEAPFDQNKIPFPAKDLKGEVLAIEIE